MDDTAPPTVRDMLDNALESAQRLAIDVIEYLADKRDEVMQRMGVLLTEVAQEAGPGGATADPLLEPVVRGTGNKMKRRYWVMGQARSGGRQGRVASR